MADTDPTQSVFDTAKQEFEKDLDDKALFQDILAIRTIDQVHEAIQELQEKQRKQGRLRYLARAEPFIKGLENYAKVIEVYVQVESSILPLIWGPIKLIILWSSETKKSFDAILTITETLGVLLPQFQDISGLFRDTERLTAAMGLFFRDMLDFYLIALKFFKLRKWEFFFEALWPKKRAEIEVVEANIEKHSQMIRSEVTIEHLREAHEARAHGLDALRRVEEAQAAQKFKYLEAAINPCFYDDELDRLRRECCRGTTRWLLQNPSLSQWLNVSSSAVNMIWLRGIPGAGKTFAAGFVVDKTPKEARTLYTFATYRHASTTTISVLQSLLFQLASAEPSTQALLTEFDQRNLKSGASAAADLLKNMVSIAGPVFVIVDGLDEIDGHERTRLLSILLDILKDSENMKLCFSSRAEDDIDRLIGKRAEIISVDKKNSGSIQAYVNHRTKQLIDKHGFSSEAENEIWTLTSPVAANSKGMFLYARIVMDNIMMLNNVEEVKRELRVLPNDLDAAYRRIIDRVNCLSPNVLRQKAINILGWVATSPVPLTLGELQQALLVGLSPDDAPTVSSLLNIVELCGPIIELKDDQPQFVHFTVQEYLSNSTATSFLDKEQAIMGLLTICISYLCYDTMSNEQSDTAIESYMLQGKFRLLDFAACNWALVLDMCVKMRSTTERIDTIHDMVAELISKRTNYWFDDPNESQASVEKNTTTLGEYGSLMHQIQQFTNNKQQDEWKVGNAERWVNLDPLTISSLRVRVHDLLERMLCKEKDHQLECGNDVTQGLRRHWGDRLFKCHFFSCPFFRRGFRTKEARDDHVKHHDKPWKCSSPGCLWERMGFASKQQRDTHWATVHQIDTAATLVPLDVVSDSDVLQPLLFELVSIGNVDELQRLLPHATSIKWEVRWEITRFAAARGPLLMVRLLVPWCTRDAEQRPAETRCFAEVALAAVESRDIELIGWVISRLEAGKIYLPEFLAAVIETESSEIFNAWEDSFGPYWSYAPRAPKVLAAAKTRAVMETLLMRVWRKFEATKQGRERWVDVTLLDVAKYSRSIPQAQVLLELGANINYPRPSIGHGLTPLHTVLKKSTLERAKFAEFLLMNGANPKYGYGSRNVHSEIGAMQISRWLGRSWEDLVESTSEFRSDDAGEE
ncbi:putative NACHT domain protein [Rosellinia necatrix]|uniref:Putative NACHT domain protein n=1 Tax=Rosellinia necatrix TaxID=77044 RepID=A0A1W2TPV2_ROSNE|nr:putative NACHT domain protein [Rosellinia necatrix]